MSKEWFESVPDEKWKNQGDRERAYKQVLSLPHRIQNLLATLTPGEDTSDTGFWDELLVDRPNLTQEMVDELSMVHEMGGNVVEAHIDRRFQNWGRTITAVPAVTFVPRTRVGIQNIVKWARRRKLHVRCAGYRHSWNTQFADTGEVLITLLPLKVTEQIPSWEPAMQPEHFQWARMVDEEKGWCEFGAATTMEQIRVWSTDDGPGGGGSKWSLPINVVMVEISLAGAVLAMCHGAGHQHQTLADLVQAVEYVDHHGDIQKVENPKVLRALAGSFGLFGVVVSLTMKLVPMEYVILNYQKLPEVKAIPRVTGEPEQKEFEDHCAHDFYCEWFWFPGQKDIWINSFRPDGDRAKVKHYPDDWLSLNQWIQSYLSQKLLTQWPTASLNGALQAEMLGDVAMHFLPVQNTDSIPEVTYLSDALHFRKGVQNTRVRNFEVDIPLYGKTSDPQSSPDWTLCNRAWWDAREVVAAMHEEAPLRLALEMRVMGDSNMILASQTGNRFGTCLIEVVSTLTVPEAVWTRFKQSLVDRWFNYKDPHTGKYLRVRPHWSKEWIENNLKVRGKSMLDYMRTVYSTPLREFSRFLPKDLNHMFSNHMWRTLLQKQNFTAES